jgi:hypothetical protein
MPYTPEAYAYTPVKYVAGSGSIPALLLYERDGLSYLRFQTKSWPHYDGWGLWTTAGIFSEHVVTADPHEPAVADLLQELEREVAAQEQHRTNGQRASQAKQENGQHAKMGDEQHVHDKKRVTQGNGVKPAKTPARQRKARASEAAVHSLKPVRSIAGLTLTDFGRRF